jgi:cell wall-associated NlpC family hydrolase
VAILSAVGLAGCGVQAAAPHRSAPSPRKLSTSTSTSATTAPVPAAHPQAVEPVAGAVPEAAATSAAAAAAVPPSQGSLARPRSDATIRRELAQSGLTPNAKQATLTPAGLAVAPIDAPPAVQEIIQAGNEIAHLPYVWGGGHVTYADTGYDCSGSISFVFAAAHLLSSPVVSGDLMNWGAPGGGKWITVFANAGHTFMYIAGLRFDTVALAQSGSRWSNRSANESDLGSFAVRHPPGL